MTTRKTFRLPPFRGALAAALLAALPAFLAGCLVEDKEDPEGFLEGQPLSALKGAKAAVALDGKLYVANRDSSANGIAVVDLATEKVETFHKSTLPPHELALAGDSALVVSESDFVTGALSRLDLKSGAWQPGYKSIDSDHLINASEGRVFLMERGLGVVTGFTGGVLADGNVVLNANTGAKSNPYRTAVVGDAVYITRYGSASLLILESGKKDGGARDSIDLAGYASDSLKGTPGAIPHMDAVAAYGDKLFVTVQRLTGYKALDTSKVLIIDSKTRKVTGEIALKRKNPIAASARGKWLFVSCVEGYGTHTGAVERIDMEKAEHAGIVVEEKDLTPPSDLVDFAPAGDSKGYVIHTADFKTGHINAVSLP